MMELEERSMTEIRSMASAMGVKVSFGDPKSKIIKEIRSQVERKAAKPLPFAPIGIKPEAGSSQDNVLKVLETLRGTGLIVTFPTNDTWHMQCGKKQDSGTMNMPLLSIVRCAETLCR